MAKERKKRPQAQGNEVVVVKKEDIKSQEKERLLAKVEKDTNATEEANKDLGKSAGQNESKNKNGGEIKEQAEKMDVPSAKPKTSPPTPPEEVVLKVFMHCEGCAKKVRKSLKGLEGVEVVKTDCKTNTVVVKGKKPAEDPKNLAETLYKKSGKRAEILSPTPAPPVPKNLAIVEMLMKKKEEKANEKKEHQETVVAVLKVCMHCEACAGEIKRRIQKLSGVQGVETTLGTSEVKVKGNFDPKELVRYIYKHTGKHAVIVKQELMPAADKPATTADVKPVNSSISDNTNENDINEKEEKTQEKPKEEIKDKDESSSSPANVVAVVGPSESNKGTGDHHNYYYFPRYPMEHAFPYPHPYQYQYPYPPPPPQIFSDENPNACIVM